MQNFDPQDLEGYAINQTVYSLDGEATGTVIAIDDRHGVKVNWGFSSPWMLPQHIRKTKAPAHV